MIGNHLLEYRLMKDHQERLLTEGQLRQELHTAKIRLQRTDRPRNSKSVMRRQHGLPSIVDLERALVVRLSTDACRRARRLARQRAIERFARTHSSWYNPLFEQSSLRSLPDDFFRRSPSSVARSWAAQFPYYRETSRDHDVSRLEAVARDFQQLLAEEERRLAVAATC